MTFSLQPKTMMSQTVQFIVDVPVQIIITAMDTLEKDQGLGCSEWLK